jgi:hypothetical protein
MSKGDKLRQIRCRLLSLFVAQVRPRHFDLYDCKGMVSRRKLPKVRQDEREKFAFSRCFGMFPSTPRQRVGVGVVRAN